MFNITQYLQYKNTLDGKPRVLTEGKDYNVKTPSGLYFVPNGTFDDGWKQIILFSDEWDLIAKLEDCKELVTIRLSGTGNHDFVWTEGDVFEYQHGGKFLFSLPEVLDSFLFEDSPDISSLDTSNKKIGSFFDDPAHYSKLLWDCSEEEGWQKVFDLLGIKS